MRLQEAAALRTVTMVQQMMKDSSVFFIHHLLTFNILSSFSPAGNQDGEREVEKPNVGVCLDRLGLIARPFVLLAAVLAVIAAVP